MRPLAPGLAALALFAAPLALSAQASTQQPLPSHPVQPPHAVQPLPPVKPRPPHTMPTGGAHYPNTSYHPNGNRYGSSYPVVIDSSVLNRYLATATPAAKHTQPPHQTNNGEEVFETHSTDDAK